MSDRVASNGSDPRPIGVANLLRLETAEFSSKRASDPHAVDTKDRRRRKKGNIRGVGMGQG